MARKKTGTDNKAVANKGGAKRPLCIIGTATSAGKAPFDDLGLDGEPLYEIWAIDCAFLKPDVTRIDRLYEMHPRRYWGAQNVIDRLNSFGGPVFMQDHYDEIPLSEAVPYEEIKKRFYWNPMGENLYVTNTITWMLLHALIEGYTNISLYGVHMAHETEYAYQRSSCSWVLGIMHGLNLAGAEYKLTIAEESSLMRAEYEYGYAEPTKAMQYIKERITGMNAGIQEARKKIDNLERSKLKTEGAISEAQHLYEKLAGWK